jgi:hypothetical protein
VRAGIAVALSEETQQLQRMEQRWVTGMLLGLCRIFLHFLSAEPCKFMTCRLSPFCIRGKNFWHGSCSDFVAKLLGAKKHKVKSDRLLMRSASMVSKLKKLAIGTVATAGLLFGQGAVAGLLTVSIDGLVCADGAACDTNLAPNVVTFSPVIPGFNVTVTTSFSNNPGSPGFTILDVTWSIASLNTTGGALTIEASQTDFAFPASGSTAILQSVCSGDVLNGNVTCQEWADLTNTLFGLGPVTPGPQGPFTAPFSNTALSAPYATVAPFSITDRLLFNLGPNGTSTGDLRTITPAPTPEPATLLLVGAALAGLGFARRRKQS